MFSLPIDKFRQNGQLRIVNHNILYTSMSLDNFGCQNFRRYTAISDSTIVHKRIQLSEQKMYSCLLN